MVLSSPILRPCMLLVFAFVARSEQKGLLASYWGQFEQEGSLASACKSGRYEIIMLAFLGTFGGGRKPVMDLAGHCDVPSGECRSLSSEISACQQRDIKILLSIGGATESYSLETAEEANELAEFLWNNFLGGNPKPSSSRPLGDAVLDGIDFDIEHGLGFGAYAVLAKRLKQLGEESNRGVLLGAAPQCPFRDANLGPGRGSALSTGLFDFVWVQFYNNDPCMFDPSKHGDVSNMIAGWKQWTSSVPHAKIYLGLPASPDAASDHFSLTTGFIPSDVLVHNLLPKIKKSKNYGGVMLWSVFHDKKHKGSRTPYSAAIKSSL